MDLTQLWQFVSTLKAQQLAGIAMLAFAAYYYRNYLLAQLARLKTPYPAPAPVAGPVIDEDAAEFQSLHKLRKRFERNKCKEGIAAVDVCLTHFFHAEGQ